MNYTGLASKQMPRKISNAFKFAMMPTVIALQSIGIFWTTVGATYDAL